jgi:ribonuclease BN (tRNA processing enzyme)
LNNGDTITDQAQIEEIRSRRAPRREELRPGEKAEDFELVDATGTMRGLTAPRWLCHLLGLRHRSAHVLLTSPHAGLGRVYLFQIRSWTKSDSPGHIDISAAGHVVQSASVEASALAELNEELGVSACHLEGGGLRDLGGYEHRDSKPEKNFFNCEWRQVFAGHLTPEAFSILHFADGEVAGLYLCPEAQVVKLLELEMLPMASALRQSLPRCLRALGLIGESMGSWLLLPRSERKDLVELELWFNGVLAAFRREPGCSCARCNDPDVRQNGNASVSLILKRDGNVVEHHLIDVGQGVVENLVAFGAPLPVSSISLTHAHFDHIAGLDHLVGSLARAAKSGQLPGQRIPIPLHATPKTWEAGPQAHFPFFMAPDPSKQKVVHRRVVPGSRFVPGEYPGLALTALPVVHYKDSVIYVVEFWRDPKDQENGAKPNAKILLCWDLMRFLGPGDTHHHQYKAELTETCGLLRDADLLVMEINTWHPRPSTHHISYTEAKPLIELWNPNRVAFLHYSGAEDLPEGMPVDPQNTDPTRGPVAAADLQRAIARDLGTKASVGYAGQVFKF